MVYDLGGGTFDVSIIEIGDGVIEVLATAGDNHLGGDDFDNKVTQWMLDEFKKTEGVDLSNDKMALQRLKEAAEKAKKELSTATTTNINLPFITATAEGPKHLDMTLTRAKFDELTADLIARTERPVREALEGAGLTAAELDKVLLVGGELKSTTEAVIGNQARIRSWLSFLPKGFFGTNGLTRKSGCTTPDANEAAVKAAAMEQCRECYVLCDSSKFDNISSVTFADFYRSTIITDRIPSGYEDCANIIEVQKEQ